MRDEQRYIILVEVETMTAYMRAFPAATSAISSIMPVASVEYVLCGLLFRLSFSHHYLLID